MYYVPHIHWRIFQETAQNIFSTPLPTHTPHPPHLSLSRSGFFKMRSPIVAKVIYSTLRHLRNVLWCLRARWRSALSLGKFLNFSKIFTSSKCVDFLVEKWIFDFLRFFRKKIDFRQISLHGLVVQPVGFDWVCCRTPNCGHLPSKSTFFSSVPHPQAHPGRGRKIAKNKIWQLKLCRGNI